LFISLLFQECSVVPFTGRKQLSIVPESEMITMGIASYQEFMKENHLPAPAATAAAIIDAVIEDCTSLIV
jgi:hypothetical protein